MRRSVRDAGGGERVGGVFEVHHLDDQTTAEGREVGAQLGVTWRTHDHDHLVARVDELDQFHDPRRTRRTLHECQHLITAKAPVRGVAAVPPDVRMQELTDRVVVAATDRFKAATGAIHVGLAHAADCPTDGRLAGGESARLPSTPKLALSQRYMIDQMGSAAASAQATPTELHEVADVLVAQMARIRRAGRRYAGRPAELSLLTGAQLELIKLVRRRPRVSVAEAASELGLAANTVSTLVRQLCEMGLLQRRVSETDRRMARLELSAGISRKVGAWRDRRVTSLAAEIAELPDDEQQLLARSVELLAKVADGLERAGAAER